MEAKKGTMEEVLTYEQNDADSIEDIFIKQLRCLKDAVLLIDDVLSHYKKAIEEARLIINQNQQNNNINTETVTHSLNHILNRLAILEGASGKIH